MKTILIIEDDSDTLGNLTMMLKMEGYSVLQAADGVDGFALASEHMPDLILCDVMLPGLDGHIILLGLRSDARLASIPFIFLTARSDRADLREGMNLGADDYLTKPATGEEVLAAIRARLSRVQTARPPLPDWQTLAPPDVISDRLQITPKEAEVMFWLIQGKTNQEISIILGNAEGTVKIHVSHIFEKLGVENRLAAVLLAMEKLTGPR